MIDHLSIGSTFHWVLPLLNKINGVSTIETKDFTIKIDGQDVPMRYSDEIPKIYARYFGGSIGHVLKNLSGKNLSRIDEKTGTRIARFIWTFIKNANPNVPGFKKWLNSVEELPVRELVLEIHLKARGE